MWVHFFVHQIKAKNKNSFAHSPYSPILLRRPIDAQFSSPIIRCDFCLSVHCNAIWCQCLHKHIYANVGIFAPNSVYLKKMVESVMTISLSQTDERIKANRMYRCYAHWFEWDRRYSQYAFEANAHSISFSVFVTFKFRHRRFSAAASWRWCSQQKTKCNSVNERESERENRTSRIFSSFFC